MVLFGVVLVLFGISFAVPVGALRSRNVNAQDAPVLGATVLTLTLGTLNMVALVWFIAAGDIGLATAVYGVFPLLAGLLGAQVLRRRAEAGTRLALLLPAALLTLAGLPGYFAVNVALLAAGVGAAAFLVGLVRDPSRMLKRFDPRV